MLNLAAQSLRGRVHKFVRLVFVQYDLNGQYIARVSQDFLVNRRVRDDKQIGNFSLQNQYLNSVKLVRHYRYLQNKPLHDLVQWLTFFHGKQHCEWLLFLVKLAQVELPFVLFYKWLRFFHFGVILENQLTNEFFHLLQLHQSLFDGKPDAGNLSPLGVYCEIKYGLCHVGRWDFEWALVSQLAFPHHYDRLKRWIRVRHPAH